MYYYLTSSLSQSDLVETEEENEQETDQGTARSVKLILVRSFGDMIQLVFGVRHSSYVIQYILDRTRMGVVVYAFYKLSFIWSHSIESGRGLGGKWKKHASSDH